MRILILGQFMNFENLRLREWFDHTTWNSESKKSFRCMVLLLQ